MARRTHQPIAALRAAALIPLWWLTVTSLLTGCYLFGGSDATGPRSPSSPPSSPDPPLGEALTSGAENPRELAWSLDATEVFYTSNGVALKAVDVATKAIHTIDSTHAQHLSVVPTRDGTHLLVIASPDIFGSTRNLYRLSITGGDTLRIADSVRAFAMAPDGVRLAYDTYHAACFPACDSLFAYDVRTQTRGYLTNGFPVTFSRDGAQLLYEEPQVGCDETRFECPTFALSLATDTRSAVSLGLTGGQSALLLHWDAIGVRILYQVAALSYFVRSLSVPPTTTEVAAYSGSELPDAFGIAWSADGQRIALWADSLVVDQGSPQLKTHHHWRLHLIDGSGAGDRVAIGADGPGPAGPVGTALSRDGRRAAFVFQGQIHAQDLP